MTDLQQLSLEVDAQGAGSRLDRLLGRALAPRFSRSYLSALVEEGVITVDGRVVKPSFRVAEGQHIEGEVGSPASNLPGPEAMELDVLQDDEAVIIVDKPVGMIIHPGTGAPSGTLVNGLLHLYPELQFVGRADRPGIVHRLDRNTSGVMVVGRTNDAMRSLVNQFKAKTIEKEYLAVVWGRMPFDSDWIELPIGTARGRPTQRAVVSEGGRAASTFYEVERRLAKATIVRVFPRTGRTHQIRVHLAHLGFPVVGDGTYGGRVAGQWPDGVPRHMLHARRLTFDHPVRGERVTFEAPLPADMQALIARLEEPAS